MYLFQTNTKVKYIRRFYYSVAIYYTTEIPEMEVYSFVSVLHVFVLFLMQLVKLRREKHELDKKVLDQEDELDEQAGEIQQLQQAKLRLEMENEKLRQNHTKELDAREEEMEELRASTTKRVSFYVSPKCSEL